MPNTFITPDVIANAAVATLYNNAVLAGLVYRDWDSEFSGKQGSTVKVKTPPTYTVDEYNRNDGIQVQNITEDTFDVELDKLLDISVAVTAEELTLELDDFNALVTQPVMEAFNQEIDARIAECLVDNAASVASGTSEPHAAFRTARARMTRAKLPFSQRYAVLSPEATSDITGDDLFRQVDTSGSTDGLREGVVGRVSGFDTYESQVFGYGAGDRGQADGVAFHRSSIALVTRALALPMGKTGDQAAIASYKGFGIRVVKGYDMDQKQDTISFDLLMGVQAVEPRQAGIVELNFGQGS